MFHNYSLDKRAVRMPVVSGLVELLRRRGVPAEISLEGTGIQEAMLNDPEARVTYRQRIRQLENMMRLVEPGEWLDWQRDVSISDYGLLGYAMMSSATLEKAVQIASK